MTKYLFPLCVALLTFSQATELRAQLFNTPASQPIATAQQATAQQAMAQQATTQQVIMPQQAVPQPSEIQQAGGAAAAAASTVEQTGWAGIPLPKITMPKLTLPSLGAITAPMKAGARKITAGTKKAWEGTKEIFSVGKKKPATRSRQPQQPKKSFWKRLLVREPGYKVPQTVGEFMSQPRLDP